MTGSAAVLALVVDADAWATAPSSGAIERTQSAEAMAIDLSFRAMA